MKVLLLRTCKSDLTSYNGFRWPESGLVEAPDWNATPRCGGGLHGLLWGEGDGCLLDWDKNAKWLVFEADSRNVVNIDNHKSKAKKGKVVYCGDRKGASDYILAHNTTGRVLAVVGAMVTVGDNQIAIVGYKGTATAGHNGTAIAGFCGTATVGDYGTATAGHNGKSTAGYYGTAVAGYYGTAVAGNEGTATAGDDGTATAGHNGTATAGDYGTAMVGDYGTAIAGFCGTATAGNYGTATAGNYGTAMAGDGGRIQIEWCDGSKYRLAVEYVGKNGIEANKPYIVKDEKLVLKA